MTSITAITDETDETRRQNDNMLCVVSAVMQTAGRHRQTDRQTVGRTEIAERVDSCQLLFVKTSCVPLTPDVIVSVE